MLEALRSAGFDMGPPWIKKIRGDIWELRVSLGVEMRLFFCRQGRRFVILHAIKKKQQRTPKSAIETAEARWQEYQSRSPEAPQ